MKSEVSTVQTVELNPGAVAGPVCRKCGKALPEGAAFCPACGVKQAVKPRKSFNGAGSVYKRGKTWAAANVVSYNVGDDGALHCVRNYRGGFRTKREAAAYLSTMQSVPLGKTTLQSLWDGYSASAYTKLSQSKQTAFRIAWGKLEPLAARKIADLTIEELQALVTEKAPTYYPARDMRTVLSHLYDRAIAQRYTTVNLSKYIELPKLVEAEQATFTDVEISKLWRRFAGGDLFVGYILLMIYSGMMPGELLACRKEYIDWDQRLIVGAGLKTAARKEKPLVLADVIMPVLEQLCEFSKGPKLVTMNKDNFYQAYHDALKRAEIRDIPPYSCRHTTATDLAIQNIPVATIREIMRHSRITTTQRYIHLDNSVQRAAVNQTADRFSGAAAGGNPSKAKSGNE